MSSPDRVEFAPQITLEEAAPVALESHERQGRFAHLRGNGTVYETEERKEQTLYQKLGKIYRAEESQFPHAPRHHQQLSEVVRNAFNSNS